MLEFIKESTLEQLIVVFSIPLYAFIIIFEMILSSLQHRNFYTIKDTFSNIYLMLLNMGLDLISRAFTWAVLMFFFSYRLFTIENPILYWSLLFLAEDLAYYTLHYFDHFSRFFWAVHVSHHSSEKFNLTTGFRSSVFQPLYRFVYFIPLALMGFKIEDIAVMFSITQIYGILVHTPYIPKLKNTPFGFFEKIFVSPSHHRVHHGSNIEYLDKNMGMCLIIWDKLFGTYQEEIDGLEIKYGIVSPIENPNAWNIVFHEWKKIAQDLKRNIDLKTKMGYLFRAPGWSHDGSTKTSKQLRNEIYK